MISNVGKLRSSIIYYGDEKFGHYSALWCNENDKSLLFFNDSRVEKAEWKHLPNFDHFILFYQVESQVKQMTTEETKTSNK